MLEFSSFFHSQLEGVMILLSPCLDMRDPYYALLHGHFSASFLYNLPLSQLGSPLPEDGGSMLLQNSCNHLPRQHSNYFQWSFGTNHQQMLGYLVSTHRVCHEATGPPCVTNITAYCSNNNLHKQQPIQLQFIPQVAAPFFLFQLCPFLFLRLFLSNMPRKQIHVSIILYNHNVKLNFCFFLNVLNIIFAVLLRLSYNFHPHLHATP